jgi:glycine cleavage system aminomethyltransferase T
MLAARTPLARTPLHHWHLAHGARLVERDGWSVVAAYSQPDHEAEAARASLGVVDITSFGSIGPSSPVEPLVIEAAFWLLGPRLDELLRRLAAIDLRPVFLFPNSRLATAFAGVEAFLLSPAGLSLPSLQVHVSWDLGEYVWERILDAGTDLRIVPLGLEALALLGVRPDAGGPMG